MMLWNKRMKEESCRKLSNLRFDSLMSVAERLLICRKTNSMVCFIFSRLMVGL